MSNISAQHALDPRSSVTIVQRALNESVSEAFRDGTADAATISAAIEMFFADVVDRREKNMVEMMTKIFKTELKEQTKTLQRQLGEVRAQLGSAKQRADNLEARLNRSVNGRNEERKMEFKRLLMLRQIFQDAGFANVSSTSSPKSSYTLSFTCKIR